MCVSLIVFLRIIAVSSLAGLVYPPFNVVVHDEGTPFTACVPFVDSYWLICVHANSIMLF